MFSFGKAAGFRLPKPDDITEAAYRAHNTYGPKAWYKKAKDFILLRKSRKHPYDTESSSTPSSAQEETVKKRLIVREFSDTRKLGEDESARLSKRTANSCLLITRFLYGLGLVQVFHLLITYQSMWDPVEAGVWFGFLGFSIAYGMAFSKAVRAIAVLVIPIMCTSSGRAILISYSTMMVLTGPMNNIAHNYGEMSRSLICGNELGFNVTQGLKSKIQEKQFEFLDAMDNTIDTIVSAVERAQEIYENVADRIVGIANAIGKINRYLSISIIICEKDSTSYICNLPGNIAKTMKKIITQPVAKSVQMMKRLFFLGVHFDHEFEFNVNRTKSAKQIREDMMNDVKDKFGYVNDVLYWTRMFTAFSTFLVIFKAAMYRKKYLTRNDFDNCYITAIFKHLDRKAGKHERPTILPLRFKESKKYISPKRCCMSRAEIKKCFRGWMFVTTNLVWSLFIMWIDWSMFWSMSMLTRALSTKSTTMIEDLVAASQKSGAFNKATSALGAFFTLNIFGQGLVPIIYRAVIKALQKVTRKQGLDINIDKCLPKPSLPNFPGFIVIFCILQSCYILVYIQAFMLRLRRYIMARHYPERERQRVMYLRKKILNNRGIGNVEDLKKTIRSAVDTVDKNQTRQKKSCWGRLIKWSNRRGIKGTIARKLTGRDKHLCSLCKFSGSGSHDELFTKCRRPGCAVEYCKPCFDDLHRICPSCLMRHSGEKQKIRRLSRILGIEPVSEEKSGEVGDLMDDFVPSSGISDSSDEDKKGEEVTLATEEYLNSLKKEADATLRAISESNLGSRKIGTAANASKATAVNEGAGTSDLRPDLTIPVVDEEAVNVTQVSENMTSFRNEKDDKRKRHTGRRIKRTLSRKLRPKRSCPERRGLLAETESDSELDLR